MILRRLIQAHRQLRAVRHARRLIRKVSRAAARGDMTTATRLMPQVEAACAQANALRIWCSR